MIYTSIITLLVEKLFYLLSPKSFSFQIVSGFIGMFVKFSNFLSPRVGLLTPFSVRRGGLSYIMIVLGRVFAPFKSCPGGLGDGYG